MAAHRPPSILAVSNTIYSLLLRACPAGYRHAYGRLMAQAFGDLASDAYRRRGAWGVLVLWMRILPDTSTTVVAEHIVAMKEQRAVAASELATAGGAPGAYTMRSSLSTAGTWAVSIATLLVGLLSIWPFYFLALFALSWRLLGSPLNSPPFNWIAVSMLFWTAWPSIFLSDLGRYLALSAVGILLALAALRFGRPSRVLRVAEALTLVAILVFPWLFHYQAPLVAAPGHVMHVPTMPGLVEGVAKQAQAFAELIPSTYTLLGWSRDGVLYYQETVKATQTTRTWAYVPGAAARPQLVAAPTDIVPSAVSPRQSLLPLVRAPVSPASAEPASRGYAIRQDGLASPDGRWVAAVARHTYGPEDVVVVALE